MIIKKLPVGVDSFKKLRREDCYYVDKTGLLADLMAIWGEVNLFTRPRRFGKTLNMSMLKYFFEIGGDKRIFKCLPAIAWKITTPKPAHGTTAIASASRTSIVRGM